MSDARAAMLALATCLVGAMAGGFASQDGSWEATASAWSYGGWHLPPLPPLRCPGGDFADLVAAECHLYAAGAVPEGQDLSHKRTGPARESVTECEARVTARELRNTLIGSYHPERRSCVGQIFDQTRSVAGIEAGVRIPPGFQFVPHCGARDSDPDVVVLKGMALALLHAERRNPALLGLTVDKIAAGVVPSLTPPGTSVSMGHAVDGNAFASKLANVTLMYEVLQANADDAPQCWEPVFEPAFEQVSNPVEEQVVEPVVQPVPQPVAQPVSATVSAWSDASSGKQRRALQDASGATRRHLSDVAGSSRQLQCSDCDNADSFPCAYCWKQNVCDDMYWCHD